MRYEDLRRKDVVVVGNSDIQRRKAIIAKNSEMETFVLNEWYFAG